MALMMLAMLRASPMAVRAIQGIRRRALPHLAPWTRQPPTRVEMIPAARRIKVVGSRTPKADYISLPCLHPRSELSSTLTSTAGLSNTVMATSMMTGLSAPMAMVPVLREQ